MQRMGLNAADFRAYLRALENTHERRIILRILDRSGKHLREISPMVLDGQVTVDTSQKPARSCTMTILDPTRSIGFEADGLADLPLHQQRMIRVGYCIRVPALDQWVNCWIFTGPLDDLKRTGALVELVAYGKESMGLGTAWTPRQFAKGKKKTDIIRSLLWASGETMLSVPDLATKLPARFTVKKLDTWWDKARQVASSMDRQLYYDGYGRAVMRHRPGKPVYTFDGALLTDPAIGRPGGDFENIWTVIGRKPKGAKHRVAFTLTLPKGHDLSPWSLARGGKPFYRGRVEENDQIRSKAEAKAKAVRLRNDGARLQTEFGFDAMPIPCLEEGDLVRSVPVKGRGRCA